MSQDTSVSLSVFNMYPLCKNTHLQHLPKDKLGICEFYFKANINESFKKDRLAVFQLLNYDKNF